MRPPPPLLPAPVLVLLWLALATLQPALTQLA